MPELGHTLRPHLRWSQTGGSTTTSPRASQRLKSNYFLICLDRTPVVWSPHLRGRNGRAGAQRHDPSQADPQRCRGTAGAARHRVWRALSAGYFLYLL